jgi:transposase-like protein
VLDATGKLVRAGGRRGETARQLIRRAKHASRRRFPAEEKIRIVLEGIRAEVSVPSTP